MEFRLTYRGPLRSRARAVAADKQALRRYFHSQLRQLWTQSPLNEMPKLIDPALMDVPAEVTLLKNVGAFQFAPLISATYGWNTVADLEILFLRPSPPGALIRHGGDLDNRIKTLMDSLRMPCVNELPMGDLPGTDEKPFFVLMSDDALATSFSVVTDRLLTPAHNDDVELVILVKVGTTRTSWTNISIIG